jgi:ABC-type transport system substrate-binding protein
VKSAWALVLVLFLFVFPLVQPMGSLGNSKVIAASASSCPANQILRVTIPGGAPNAFNYFFIFADAPRWVLNTMYLSFTPGRFTNGSLYWGGSVLSWMKWSSDYTAWTFHIKSGLKWSDGTPVTTADVQNTFSSSFAFNSTFDVYGIGSIVASEKPINSDTIVFNLNQPDAVLDDQLSNVVLMPAVMPPSYVAQGAAFNGFGTLVTDGPFYLSNYQNGATEAVLLRNPYFQPQPKACEIEVSMPESPSAGAIFLSGDQTDFSYIEEGDIASLNANPNLGTTVIPGLAEMYIVANITVAPYNSLYFRQALAHAINMTQVQLVGYEGYGLTAQAAEGDVSPASGLYSKNQEVYNYSTTEALALLSKDGITQGSDGKLRYSNGTLVSLTFYVENDDVPVLLSGTEITAELQSLGFTVNQVTESKGTIIGSTYGNVGGIWNAMILTESIGAYYGDPYFSAKEAWQVYCPFASYPWWVGPPGSVPAKDYEGNLSALDSTRDTAVQQTYLNNIQLINSQNLPIIMISYPPVLFGYNKLHWNGWSSNFLAYEPVQMNLQFFASLSPVTTTTTTTQATSVVTSVVTSVATSVATSIATSTATSVATSVVTSTATSTSTAPSSDLLTIGLAAAVVIVIVVVAAAYVVRSRGKPKT